MNHSRLGVVVCSMLLLSWACVAAALHASSNAQGTEATAAGGAMSLNATMAALRDAVYTYQAPHDVPYRFFPPQMGYRSGAFASEMHVYVVGSPLLTTLRRRVRIPDENMFVPMFALDALVQVAALRPELAVNESSALLALAPILAANRDPYRPPTTPIFGFWPQLLMPNPLGIPSNPNPLRAFLQQWSINMSNAASNWWTYRKDVAALLRLVGLGWVADLLVPLLNGLVHIALRMFNIPTDADDTSTLLALGANLQYYGQMGGQSRSTLPALEQLWEAQGFDVGSAAEAFVASAYCPAGPASNNLIDPRSYYWARPFLNNLTDPQACIFTTWLETNAALVDRYGRGNDSNRIGALIPYNLNNIDPSVAADTLLGLTAQALLPLQCPTSPHHAKGATAGKSNDPPAVPAWFLDPSFVSTYTTTASFLAWAVANQPTQARPDLETLYYPPVLNLMWFAARTAKFMRSRAAALSPCGIRLPAHVAAAQAALEEAFAAGGQPYVTARVQQGASCMNFGGGDNEEEEKSTSKDEERLLALIRTHTDLLVPEDVAPPSVPFAVSDSVNDGSVYACWDDFLGSGDRDASGAATPHADDRFYTTAVAVNALLDAYTVEVPPSGNNNTAQPLRLAWTGGKPPAAAVVALVEGGIQFLQDALAAPNVSFMNAFFAGSVRGVESLPFFYPANTIVDMMTGLPQSCDTLNVSALGQSTLWGVQGTIPDAVYDGLVRSGCGGIPTDVKPPNFSSTTTFFPFWSAPVLSKAFALLAMAKYSALPV